MKHTLLFLLATLLMTLCPARAAVPDGIIDFKGVPAPFVLAMYKKMCGLELVIDSRAKQLQSPITLHVDSPITKSDLMKLVEKTLIEQAGIVITKLDDKRISVTFNDALLKFQPKTGFQSQSPGK